MHDPRPHQGEGAGGEASPLTVTPVLVAELLAEGQRMPVYVHVIDHPDARVLVDTGMTQLHPAVADMDPRLTPLNTQADFDLDSIDVVINTHLHFDHCGGNHLFTGRPIYVQRRELDDARNEDDYTIREWVEAPGVQYVPVDGALELLPGLRLVPAPGHTRGSQVVVVETGGRPVVIGGDMAVFFAELDEPRTEGQRLVRGLDPGEVWLSHEHEEDGDRTALAGAAPVEDDDAVVTRLEVDGDAFDLRADEFGGTHYTWVSGPNVGYGFSVSPTGDLPEEHRANIVGFLAMINPTTGFIADDD